MRPSRPRMNHRSGVVIGRQQVIELARVRWAGGGLSLVAATDPRVSPAVDVLNLGRSMWLLGVAGWWVLMSAATLRVAQDSRLTRAEWSR